MSVTSPTVTAVDTELDRVYTPREQLLRVAPSPAQAHLIADLYDHEAWLWSVLFEHSRARITWRVALAAQAHAHARTSAQHWRRRAAAEMNAPAPYSGTTRLNETAGAA